MRYYSNLAQEMTLTASASSGDTTLSLSLVTGLPSSFPFTLVVDPGESNEEVVTCTNLVGTTATVVRGADGTSATSHLSGAKVRHMISSRDLAEPQAHMAASTGVHGLTGSAVGTTDAQTLTNKTMSGASNTFTNIPKSAIPSDVVYTTGIQTLTGKTLNGSNNTFVNIPQSALPATSVSTTGTQTVTNKTLDATNAIDAGALTSGTVSKSRLPADTLYGTVDTGYVTTGFVLGAGFDTSTTRARVYGKTIQIDVRLFRNGGTITADANNGNIVNTKLVTVPAQFRPDISQYTVGTYQTGNSYVAAYFYIDTAGAIWMTQGSPGVNIVDNTPIACSFTFLS